MNRRGWMLAVAAVIVTGFGGWYSVKAGRQHDRQTQPETPPHFTVDLAQYGLPANFFRTDADECIDQIIQYRLVSWLDNKHVAVGFSTNPNCRPSRNTKVDGNARILVFSASGVLRARRDIPYGADGGGILVAEGEAGPGPNGTLLFRIQEVKNSKSSVELLGADLP